MKKTKIYGGILAAIAIMRVGVSMAANPQSTVPQMSYDVELNTEWLDTYVNKSSILRYVIKFFNNGTETANNINIEMTLPRYLKYIWSNYEDVSSPEEELVYDQFDPCLIDLSSETGVYMGLFNDFAQQNSFPDLFSLLLVNPDTEGFNEAPYNGNPELVGDFLIAEIVEANGTSIRNVLLNMTSIDVSQDYPQCGERRVTAQQRNIDSLTSGTGGEITTYLQILEPNLFSDFNIHNLTTTSETINSMVSTDTIDNGPIYNNYTNTSDTESESIFLTKAGHPEFFSNQDMLDAIINENMTDKEKAIAIRQFVKDYTLNYPDPNSEQRYAGNLRWQYADYSDPVRMLNTLYGMCGEINSTFVSLATMAGLTGRINGLEGHIPAEIFIDGNRAFMDADGGAYWTDPGDGHIYSMAELEANPSIITNNPQDLNYEPEYYAGLIASTGDNTVGLPYSLIPNAAYNMTLQLYPHDIISYGTYDLGQNPPKYYGEGTIRRTLNPDFGITDVTATSFTFRESLPYLIINTYIESDGLIPDDVSVYLKRGSGNVSADIPLGYLHEKLGYTINTSGRSDNYYDYSLRFKCQTACDVEEVMSHITVTSSFTYNSLVLAHDYNVDIHSLSPDGTFEGISGATEYNTNNQISLTTTLSTDQDDIPLNNSETNTLNTLLRNSIILPATGELLQDVLIHRGYITNDPDSFFTQTGWLTTGVDLDFYNTFTIAENIIFSSDDARVQVFLPEGLIFTPSESCHGGNGGLERPEYLSSEEAVEEFNNPNRITNDLEAIMLISDTCEDVRLDLSQPVKIRMYVDNVLGNTVSAKASSDRGVTREVIPATRISDHIIEIETTHFSLFTVSSTTNTPTPSGGGGGGGSASTPKDNCPTGDFSPSYYDGICGTPTTPTTVENTGTVTVTGTTNTCNVSNELVLAYDLAFDLGVTSATDVCQADMYGPVLRKYLAKFLTVYATKVLGMKPDTTRICTFNDVSNESTEMQFYMKIACQLGLMGLEQDGTPATIFNPNELVNRAQFGTVFSRLIFGPKYNIPMSDSRPRYQNHLNILKKTNIMDKIDEPYMVELRGYVMLMMMKAKTLLRK